MLESSNYSSPTAIWTHLDEYAVARQHANVVYFHLASEMGQDHFLHAIHFYPKGKSGQGFNDDSLFWRHDLPH